MVGALLKKKNKSFFVFQNCIFFVLFVELKAVAWGKAGVGGADRIIYDGVSF